MDRPILFSAPMIRALLAGTKTQTRRIIKPRGHASLFSGEWTDDYVLDPGNADWRADEIRFAVGDRLWVKETWRTGAAWDRDRPSIIPTTAAIRYEADGHPLTGKVRVSIHMPRWASRLTLHVTDVRVQRLDDITEEDAIAEGVECVDPPGGDFKGGWRFYTEAPEPGAMWSSARDSYRDLWTSINGPSLNPWVVVISFDVERANIADARAS